MQPSETPTQQPVHNQPCPQCGVDIPVYEGFSIWCDACGWNLKPLETEPPRNELEALYMKLNTRLSHDLFASLLKEGKLKPKLTPAKVMAFFVAACVHLITLGFLILGVLLIVGGWPSVLIVIYGVLALGVAWLLRPRLPKLDKNDIRVSREDAPTLYSLLDQIADVLGARRVQTVVVNGEYNAAFTQVGLRRAPVVFIGLPYFTVLSPQERVSLLSHEIAHGVNGDPARGLFVGTAANSLAVWHDILTPGGPTSPFEQESEGGCFIMPAHLLMRGIARVVYGVLFILVHLIWRDSQRAEYLADVLEASVSGKRVAISALEKLYFGKTYELTVQKVLMAPGKLNLFEVLEKRVANVPRREIERIKRAEQMSSSQVDTTHPPTTLRMRLIEALPDAQPKVTLSDADARRIMDELEPVRPEIEQSILDEYGERLYG